MSSIIKISLFKLFFALALGYFLTPVSAAGEFQADYKVDYLVEETGSTKVNQEVSLTNLSERYYATEYTIRLGTGNIFEVKATDQLGPVATSINKSDDFTEIKLTFNDKVVGRGQVLKWQLSYLSKDYARKSGLVWEVDIPTLNKTEDINEYDVRLIIPTSFGQPAYLFPQPQTTQANQGLTTYTFGKDSYLNYGISAAFGNYQVFKFNLDYHLKNPNLYPIKEKIAILPDTAYQMVILNSLEPKPLNITIDDDGNWLAEYELTAGEVVNATAQGFVKLFPQPKTQKIPILSPESQEKYLSQQKYWEVEDAQIRDLAQELKTPDKIYDYVVSHLNYDETRLEGDLNRFGARAALANPNQAVCMEFTDLFIALARAAGIPAREINGFAYTSDPRRRPLSLSRISGDVLHAWPEYYDKNRGWVSIDPTWGSTTKGRDYFHTLDLNHVVFAIHGLDSEWPPPAGAYKFDSTHQNDVHLEFSEPTFSSSKEIEVNFELPGNLISGLPINGYVVIRNDGNIVYPQSFLRFSSDYFSFPTADEREIGPIPPTGFTKIPVSVQSSRVNESRVATINADYDGQKFSHQVVIRPFLLVDYRWILMGGGGLGALGLIFIGRRVRSLSL